MKAAVALPALLLLAASGPGTPQRWTPPAITSDQYEASPAFTPDGRQLFLIRGNPSFGSLRLLQGHCTANGWSAPQRPSFAAPEPVDEADPFITRDGKRLYYISTRHRHAAVGNEDYDIWYVDRQPGGGWGTPHRMPEPVNSPASELLPRQTADGRLFFGSARAGGHGGTDIYVATPGAEGRWAVANLGPSINSAREEYEADVSTDGRNLVLVADRGDRSHLYRFAWTGGKWVERDRVPARPDVFQVGPLLSPKGDRLLFAQADGDRSGEIFLSDLVADPDRSWPPRCPADDAGR